MRPRRVPSSRLGEAAPAHVLLVARLVSQVVAGRRAHGVAEVAEGLGVLRGAGEGAVRLVEGGHQQERPLGLPGGLFQEADGPVGDAVPPGEFGPHPVRAEGLDGALALAPEGEVGVGEVGLVAHAVVPEALVPAVRAGAAAVVVVPVQVPLAGVGGAVAGVPEALPHVRRVLGQGQVVGPGADAVGVAPGEEPGPGRGAEGRGGVAAVEGDALRREAVKARRPQRLTGGGVPRAPPALLLLGVGAQDVHPLGVGHDQDEVGPGGGGSGVGEPGGRRRCVRGAHAVSPRSGGPSARPPGP